MQTSQILFIGSDAVASLVRGLRTRATYAYIGNVAAWVLSSRTVGSRYCISPLSSGYEEPVGYVQSKHWWGESTTPVTS